MGPPDPSSGPEQSCSLKARNPNLDGSLKHSPFAVFSLTVKLAELCSSRNDAAKKESGTNCFALKLLLHNKVGTKDGHHDNSCQLFTGRVASRQSSRRRNASDVNQADRIRFKFRLRTSILTIHSQFVLAVSVKSVALYSFNWCGLCTCFCHKRRETVSNGEGCFTLYASCVASLFNHFKGSRVETQQSRLQCETVEPATCLVRKLCNTGCVVRSVPAHDCVRRL